MYKCRTSNQGGGGVAIYVKEGVKATINSNSIFMENVLESLLVDVCFNNKKYVIGSLYRCIGKHPTMTAKDQFTVFNDLLFNLLDKISSSELILGGDINLDVLKIGSCRNTELYINNLFTNGCLQIVCKPTRCTNTTATCIDHFITNVQQPNYDARILLSKISDHFPVFFTISLVRERALYTSL
jgi:hypothetical protein